MYTAEMIRNYLVQTKNQHGVIVEDYFPDLAVFCASARLHMSQREESCLTEQDIFRLKKLVMKVRKQMGSGDFKSLNVCV